MRISIHSSAIVLYQVEYEELEEAVAGDRLCGVWVHCDGHQRDTGCDEAGQE